MQKRLEKKLKKLGIIKMKNNLVAAFSIVVCCLYSSVARSGVEGDVLKLLGITMDFCGGKVVALTVSNVNDICTAFSNDYCNAVRSQCRSDATAINTKIDNTAWDDNAELTMGGKTVKCSLDKQKLKDWVEVNKNACLAKATPPLCNMNTGAQCPAGLFCTALAKCTNSFANSQVGPQTCIGMPPGVLTCTAVTPTCDLLIGQACMGPVRVGDPGNYGCCASGLTCGVKSSGANTYMTPQYICKYQ